MSATLPSSKASKANPFDWYILRPKGTKLTLHTAYEEGERPASPETSRIAAHGDASVFFGWTWTERTKKSQHGATVVEKPFPTH